jgi:hypothetical protein
MKRLRFVKSAALLCALVAVTGCWPFGRGEKQDASGDRDRTQARATGHAGVKIPDELKLKTLWDLKIREGQVEAAWVRDNFALIAARSPNILYLLRKQDGMNLWNCELRKPITTTYPPSISADAVMVISDGRIIRIHREWGQIICMLDPKVPMSAAPVLDTWVETSTGTPAIYVPSFADGRLWAVTIRKTIRSVKNPVPGKEPIKFPQYSASRGWAVGSKHGGHILGPITKVGGFVYACTTDGWAMALKDSTGEQIWKLQTQGRLNQGICVWGNRFYMGSSDFKLYCFNRLSLERYWALPTGSPVISRPMCSGDGKLVVCISEGQGLLGVDTASGKRLWNFPKCKQVLGVGKKAVYVSTGGGLVALDRKTGKPVWRSPMRGFAKFFPVVDQYEQPTGPKPFYLLAVTGGNEIVCLVEPGFKPGRIEQSKPPARPAPNKKAAPGAGDTAPAGGNDKK